MAKKENNYYYDTFIKGTSYANAAAAMLHACLSDYDPAHLDARLEEMHAIEHRADGVKHEMMERLVKEFLPPIEREDIVELAHTIDEVTDCVEEVLRGMYMYNVTVLRPDVREFTDVIAKCCAALTDAMSELHNFRKSTLLQDKLIAVNHLEEDGDRLYTRAMRELYVTEQDPMTVMVWTTMYDNLEKCCDCCEHVADKIEQIVLKNS